MDDEQTMRPQGPKSNGLGADYGAPQVPRPLTSTPGSYGIKRAVDPAGFYDLDNVHTSSAPRVDDGCGFTPFIDD